MPLPRVHMRKGQSLGVASQTFRTNGPASFPRASPASRSLRCPAFASVLRISPHASRPAINISARRLSSFGRCHTVAAAQAGRGGKGNGGTDEEPDWEAEMSIFKQRISRPNQLATLRELEAKVSVGKVLYSKDGLAIVSGLNTDAPLGTKVSFVTGTAGVLLWHRSDNLSFCLVLGDPSSVNEGDPVECKIKGVLQVVDDVKGPITRKDFETFNVPTSDAMWGRACDHIGRHLTQYDADEGTAAAMASLAAAAVAAAPAGPVSVASSSTGSGAVSSTSTSATTPGSAGANAGTSGGGRTRPLINQQVEMKNREQINESLLTGVKALDILTPLGRGASLLVIGPTATGKTRLALDAVQGQATWGLGGSGSGGVVAPPGGSVRSVLALVGRPKTEVQSIMSALRASGSLANTAVVVADEEAPLGHQFAAMCCACSLGERVRDEGGHSLVVVDDLRALSDVWEQLLGGLAGLGPALLREGLVKDERGRDMPVLPPLGASPSSPPTTPSGTSPSPSSSTPPSPTSLPSPASLPAGGSGSTLASGGGGLGASSDDDALVEYQGMLVSGAVAQRRGFLSTFFMRAAKMSRANGGGSMTLLPLVPGSCATGVSKRIDMSKYKTLSPEQLAKLEAALRAKQLAEELASGACSGELATEVVEEFISIADGQVVMEARRGGAEGEAGPSPYVVNPKLSITRIGTRAYYPSLEQLAPQVRLDLAQAEDARKFGGATTASGSSMGSVDGGTGGGGGAAAAAAAAARADALAQRMAAALLQTPGQPAGLAEQVTTLYAVQRGFADLVTPEELPQWLAGALVFVADAAPRSMQELARTGILTAESEAAIAAALHGFRAQWRRSDVV